MEIVHHTAELPYYQASGFLKIMKSIIYYITAFKDRLYNPPPWYMTSSRKYCQRGFRRVICPKMLSKWKVDETMKKPWVILSGLITLIIKKKIRKNVAVIITNRASYWLKCKWPLNCYHHAYMRSNTICVSKSEVNIGDS